MKEEISMKILFDIREVVASEVQLPFSEESMRKIFQNASMAFENMVMDARMHLDPHYTREDFLLGSDEPEKLLQAMEGWNSELPRTGDEIPEKAVLLFNYGMGDGEPVLSPVLPHFMAEQSKAITEVFGLAEFHVYRA